MIFLKDVVVEGDRLIELDVVKEILRPTYSINRQLVFWRRTSRMRCGYACDCDDVLNNMKPFLGQNKNYKAEESCVVLAGFTPLIATFECVGEGAFFRDPRHQLFHPNDILLPNGVG